jgi:hypothetical protein
VLDVDAFSGVRIRPVGDVAGREDTRRIRLEVLVHSDAFADNEARLRRQRRVQPRPDASDNEIGRDALAAPEDDSLPVDRAGRFLHVEDDAVLLVHAAYEVAKLTSHDALQRAMVRRDDVHVYAARGQRRRHLEADEARPQHDRAPRLARRGDDRATVSERSQVVNASPVVERRRQVDRLGAGRD